MLPLWLTKPAMKVWGWILAILAFVGILAAALWQARRRGAADARLEAEEEREIIEAENRAEAEAMDDRHRSADATREAEEEARRAWERAQAGVHEDLTTKERSSAEERVEAAKRGELSVGDALKDLEGE